MSDHDGQPPLQPDRPWQAKPVPHRPTAQSAGRVQRQEDVPEGTWHGSDTPSGTATPVE